MNFDNYFWHDPLVRNSGTNKLGQILKQINFGTFLEIFVVDLESFLYYQLSGTFRSTEFFLSRRYQWFRFLLTYLNLSVELSSLSHYITLHYITLHYRYFIRHLHLKWPVVLQQSYVGQLVYASVNRWVFSCLLKVYVSVSSWRAKGRSFHAFGPA